MYESGATLYLADGVFRQRRRRSAERLLRSANGVDINTAGCRDFYGNRNHSDRIAAYWLRQANMSASAPGVAPSQMDINPAYAPVEANPSTTVTTGTT